MLMAWLVVVEYHLIVGIMLKALAVYDHVAQDLLPFGTARKLQRYGKTVSLASFYLIFT